MTSRLRTLTHTLALCSSFALASSNAQAFDFFGLFGSSEDKETSQATTQPAAQQTTQTTNKATTGYQTLDGLIGGISRQYGVSQEQALGGLGLLVGYSASQLSPEYTQQLNSLFPGLAQTPSESKGGLGDMASMLTQSFGNRDTLNAGFSAMGMDPSLIDQFIPLISGFVGNNASPELAKAVDNTLK